MNKHHPNPVLTHPPSPYTGSVGGKRKANSASSELLLSTIPNTQDIRVSYNSACAAAGQLGLMSLYETMFTQYDVAASQVRRGFLCTVCVCLVCVGAVLMTYLLTSHPFPSTPTLQLLVTSSDFTSPDRRRNINYVLSQLLALGIVPLINENDAVSANQGYDTFGRSFADNDSLASLISAEISADLLILLTDVQGCYDRPPTVPGAKLIDIFDTNTVFQEGSKSLQGRGGMGAKVDAAMAAIQGGVPAVVIAAGNDFSAIGALMSGEPKGTLFLQPPTLTATAGQEGAGINALPTPPPTAIREVDFRKVAREGEGGDY